MRSTLRSHFRQRVTDRGFERSGTAATETFVESFETLDEISDVFARVHAAGFGTEVRAAAKRTVFIDCAAAIAAQQRACPVRMRFEGLATAGADSLGCIQSLSPGEHRGMTCQPEVTAAGAHLTLTGQRPSLQLGINRLDFMTVVWLRGFHAGVLSMDVLEWVARDFCKASF